MSYLEFGAGDISPLTLTLGGLFIASLSLLFLDLRGWQCGYGLSPTRHAKACFHDTEGWCKIWKKTNLRFGKWHEEYGKFPSEHLKVSKLGFDGILLSKKKKYELKIHWGVMSHDNEEWCKIWRGIDFFKNDMRNLTNFDPSTWKSQIVSI